MVRRPNSTPDSPDGSLPAEETLSLDHARWSGFRDGLGEREDGVDQQGFSIELLRLRKEFNPFALALTDRILRLIDFDRPGASRALRVDQDETSPRLVLVSERAPGFRLSELLERSAERGVIPDLGAALYVMRRLLATAAAIERATGVAHLAIAPERVVVSPRGSVVIVEAVVASAIEAFGGRLPPAVRKGVRLARLDAEGGGPHVDIARITLAGMAMVVGRPLDPAEEVDPLSPIVQEVLDVAAVRAGDLFAAALTPWLDRAISIEPELAFPDYAEAWEALDGIAPPPEARCSISRTSLRKYLDDLGCDASLRTRLGSLEHDRVRELRARRIRAAAGAAFVLPPPPAAAAVEEDPLAALMDMPVEVEELSSEISRQPVVIEDQPLAMAEVLEQAAPFVAEPDASLPDEIDRYAAEDAPPGDSETLAMQDEPPAEEAGAGLAAFAGDEPLADDEPAPGEHALAALGDDELLAVEALPEDSISPPEPSLDDLVDEILRRGVERELPALSRDEDLLAEPAPLVDPAAEIEAYAIGAEHEEPAAAPWPEPAPYRTFPDDAPVEEPTIEPPVQEPVDPPPVDEPPDVEEPAVDEPPHGEPPVEEPPGDEPPVQEPAPMWMRAAIEKMARSREDRPAPRPTAPRAKPKGPVFELHDEPERELEPETTTLSDIARELGLTIPAPRRDPAPPPVPAEEPSSREPWDANIRRALAGSDPAPPPPAAPPPPPAFPAPAPPPVFSAPAPPPVFSAPAPPPTFSAPVQPPAPTPPAPRPPSISAPAAPPVFVPIPSPPPVAEDRLVYGAPAGTRPMPDATASSYAAPEPAAVVPLPPPPPAPAAPAKPSVAERLPDLRASGGRFFRMAATLVLVAGGIGAAAYGGWRYLASLTAPGVLIVRSTPPGSTVSIDGKERGTTPISVQLPPGSYTIELTRRGVTQRLSASVRPREETTQTLDWSTVRLIGSLAVSSEPAGAKITVDGRGYGITPMTIPDLAVGRRRIVLEAQGGTIRREVNIEPDQTTTLHEPIYSGFLAVFAPVELQIYEGSRLLGTTENSRIMVPAGRHELTLVNKELGTRINRTVEVEPGRVAAVNITEVPAAVRPAAAPAPAPPPQEPPPQ